MKHFPPNLHRRDFLGRVGTGMAGMALNGLLSQDLLARSHSSAGSHLRPRQPNLPARARSVIQLFMTGGPSQVDLLDPKPALATYAGDRPREVLDHVESVGSAGGLLPSTYRFTRHGQSGLPFSELLPHTARCADDIAVIRSMWSNSFNHETGIVEMHSGRTMKSSPSMGSWIIYGLGTENQNLPAFVALDDPDKQILLGKKNWQSGWLPPVFQGTRFRASGVPVVNLEPQQAYPGPVLHSARTLLDRMARSHQDDRPRQSVLDARLASYQLAARMQTSATDALDLSRESKSTQELYGLDQPQTAAYGRRCLMARRLVERGVRFVQVLMNAANNNPWDHHSDLNGGLERCCHETDRGVGALLQDLKQRGLLDSTLVTWGGEFGRLPIAQNAAKPGRDHGPTGFSVWMAGGGIKGGTVHGATDEIGYKAVDQRVSVHDFHATILRCLGIDHEQLVFNHHGLDERLTGVEPAHVVNEILL